MTSVIIEILFNPIRKINLYIFCVMSVFRFVFGLDLGSFIFLVSFTVFAFYRSSFLALCPGAAVHLNLLLGFFIPLWGQVTALIFL
jgi:hypothetical protein